MFSDVRIGGGEAPATLVSKYPTEDLGISEKRDNRGWAGVGNSMQRNERKS